MDYCHICHKEKPNKEIMEINCCNDCGEIIKAKTQTDEIGQVKAVEAVVIKRCLLEEMKTALNDWIHQYALELCDKKKVRETNKRISDAGGTLAYLAQLLHKLNAL